MKRSIFLGLGLVVAFSATGCGDTSKHEAVMKEMIGALNEFADALESVKDQQSAKAAAVKINKICDKLTDITNRAKALPKVTQSQNDALEKKFKPDLEKASARIQAVAFQAGANSGGDPDFIAALKRLEEVGKAMMALGQMK